MEPTTERVRSWREADPQNWLIRANPTDAEHKQNSQEKQAGIPELNKHFAKIKEGNRVDRLWLEDERFAELVSLCGIVASHCTSAGEAAWRRDQALLRDHLEHARNGLKLALQTYNTLPSDGWCP